MPSTSDLFHVAAEYHGALPERIREYLNGRGIPDEIIDRRYLGWNGKYIIIPVFNRNGVCASFRLAKDPDDASDAPKKMLSLPGSSAELYGWEVLGLKPQRVVVCEGEFDRLVLEANDFDAVTSTGGAGSFRAEWAKEFEGIPEVYICFDYDEAGRNGALRVASLIPHAKIAELPAELGEGGDVTDFFVRFKKTREDFEGLLLDARPAPKKIPQPKVVVTSRLDAATRERVERVKRAIPIERVIEPYVKLRRVGATLVGRCPFHDDHTPSFTVYPRSGVFHCFGCRAHGDAITFLEEAEHLTFHQALDALERLQTNDETRPQENS